MTEIVAERRRGEQVEHGLGLIVGSLAAVDLPGRAPARLATAGLPHCLATFLGLGPRPDVAGTDRLIASRSTMDSLLAHGPTAAAVPPRWAERLAGIAAAVPVRWCVTAVRPEPGTVDRLEVVDAGPAGLWALWPYPPGDDGDSDPDGDSDDLVLLAPTTTTAVWAWLTRLAAPLHALDA